jgi:hypothetical protein
MRELVAQHDCNKGVRGLKTRKNQECGEEVGN